MWVAMNFHKAALLSALGRVQLRDFMAGGRWVGAFA